jgi:glucokinase
MPNSGGPWLVADIGGTNARFGLADAATGRVLNVVRLRCADFESPVDAVRHYLTMVGAPIPSRAAFALAGVIGEGEVRLTNHPWVFSRFELRGVLGCEHVLLLNDFEALAIALPRLGPNDCWAPFGPQPSPATNLPMAVVGPGTGLGVAGLVRHRDCWIPVPGEGGHATLCATTAFEADVIGVARARFGHVSAERLLSGPGMVVLYHAVAIVRGIAAAAAVGNAAQIVALADRGDELAQATVETFFDLLGAFSGSVALTFGARGGLYLGGGIVPKLKAHFAASRFRARFDGKGRFQSYLPAVPTPVITSTDAALLGAAAILAQRC